MNKIICPYCKGVCILNDNIKSCSFVCPCCNKTINLNPSCCKKPSFVFLVFVIATKFDSTKLIAAFYDEDKAKQYIEIQTYPQNFYIVKKEVFD